MHSEEILECAARLDDDESASTYATMFELRLHHKNNSVVRPPLNHDKYFALPPFAEMWTNDVFIDCGASVGDSIEQFLWAHEGCFDKIFSFEPDPKIFKALAARTRRLNEEWALDEGQINLVNAGVGAVSSKGALEGGFNVVALDDYFADQPISFIKADIESYELDMLKGAEKIIRRDRPKLAICIYHNASDMFRIQQWIDSLNLEYKFAVRHHSLRLAETVLYAWQ